MFVGAVVFTVSPRRYTASTSLLISDRADAIGAITQPDAELLASAYGFMSGNTLVARLQAIAESRQTRKRVARKCDLARKLALDEDRTMRALEGMTRINSVGDGGVAGILVGMEIQVTTVARSRLGSRAGLSVEEAGQLCADLANEYVAALDAYVTETSVVSARGTREFIEERKEEVAADLKETEDHLQALQTKHELVDPDRAAAQSIDQNKTVVQAYAMAVAEGEGLANSLQTARALLTGEDATRIEREVTARNRVITVLEEKLAQLHVESATELEGGKRALHPDVLQIQAAIESTQQELDDLEREVLQEVSRQANPTYDVLLGKVVELEVSLAGVRARQAAYGAQWALAKDELRALPPVVREYVTLARQRELQSQLLSALAKQLELAAIEEKRVSSGKFHVLDPATPPLRKSGPSVVRSAAITFCLLALTLGLIVAYRRGIFWPELAK